MLATAKWFRERYLPKSTANTDDATIERYIINSQAEIEQIIGQPVESREVTYHFDGSEHVVCPYTLKCTLTRVESRDEIGGAWTTVDGCQLVNGYLECTDGFDKGKWNYRMILNVGLTASLADTVSVDFATAAYSSILDVLCEMTLARYNDGPLSKTGEARFGLKSIAETEDGKTTSKVFAEMRSLWRRRLQQFRIVQVF